MKKRLMVLVFIMMVALVGCNGAPTLLEMEGRNLEERVTENQLLAAFSEERHGELGGGKAKGYYVEYFARGDELVWRNTVNDGERDLEGMIEGMREEFHSTLASMADRGIENPMFTIEVYDMKGNRLFSESGGTVTAPAESGEE